MAARWGRSIRAGRRDEGGNSGSAPRANRRPRRKISSRELPVTMMRWSDGRVSHSPLEPAPFHRGYLWISFENEKIGLRRPMSVEQGAAMGAVVPVQIGRCLEILADQPRQRGLCPPVWGHRQKTMRWSKSFCDMAFEIAGAGRGMGNSPKREIHHHDKMDPQLQNYQYKNGVDSQIITLERSIP